MAESVGQYLTLAAVADEDLRTYRYHLVTWAGSTAGHVTRCSSRGQQIAGVLLNKPNSGQAATVVFLGATKVWVGGAIYAGDKFTTSVSATAITLTSSENNVAGTIISNAASGAYANCVLGALAGQSGFAA